MGRPRKMLEGVHIYYGLRLPLDPPERIEEVAGRRISGFHFTAPYHRQPPHPGSMVENRWMDK